MRAVGLRRRRIGSDHSWPGFVDALSTLLLVIIFLLSVFVLAQFFLGQALSGRDEALDRLRSQVAELGDLLRLEREANADLQRNVGQLSASLQKANVDRDDMTAKIAELQSALDASRERLRQAAESGEDTTSELSALRERYADQAGELEHQQELSQAAQDEVDRLNKGITALREQLARLEAALEASDQRDKEQQAVIADLGKRLNVALAQKVEELAGYRSEFYGRLREVLGNRPDIRVEGDRFVFQAELLFASGSADLGEEGKQQLRKLAATLLQIAATIPDDLNWILRVDGHTDAVPISTDRFPSNWELSAARAISVVKFLIGEGVPPERLAATGFGEFQPLVPGHDAEANRRNRRIEMRFTQR